MSIKTVNVESPLVSVATARRRVAQITRADCRSWRAPPRCAPLSTCLVLFVDKKIPFRALTVDRRMWSFMSYVYVGWKGCSSLVAYLCMCFMLLWCMTSGFQAGMSKESTMMKGALINKPCYTIF